MNTLRASFANFLALVGLGGLMGGPPATASIYDPKVKDTPDKTGLASSYVKAMDIHGEKMSYPAGLLVAVVPSGTEIGTAVGITGYSAERDGPKAEPAVPGKVWPVGVVRAKLGDDVAVIAVDSRGDMRRAGAAGGDLFVIGTDGRLAKKGEANYPAAGTDTLLGGVGIAPDVVLLIGQLAYKA